jgi:hypothetical protein
MVEILDQSTENCLVVRLSGKITGEEYQQFLDAVYERLEANETTNLVLVLNDFELHADFAAMKKDVKFGFGDYGRVRRAAFVGDQKWLELFTRFVGPFTHAEEMHFLTDQLEAAVNWANA